MTPDPIAEGLKGLSLVNARTEEEAATVAALLLREALETEGQTAALVTPDRGLAQRVAAELKRWKIDIDDSAGVPLAATPPATLLNAVVAAVDRSFAPVALLGLKRLVILDPEVERTP